MNFINGYVFWILPFVLAAMVIVYFHANTRRRAALKMVTGNRPEAAASVHLSEFKRGWRFVLLLAVIALLGIAVARPWWGQRLIPYESKGRDLLFVFDVSKSMLATDIAPSRLAHARMLVNDLVQKTGGDRFGLIAFAGTAFLECPLTSDKTSFEQYINELSPDSIPVGGTNLEQALNTAVAAFDAAEGNHRAIILITDGDELSGDTGRSLAKLKEQDIPLFVVGLGDPNVPALVPESGGGATVFKRDRSGELVKSKLNEPLLEKIALESGGIYVRSTVTDNGEQTLLSAIRKLTPDTVGSGERTLPIERFHYFLLAALVLFFLYLFLSERPNKYHSPGVAVWLLLGVLPWIAAAAPAAETALPGAAEPEAAAELPAGELLPASAVEAYNQALELQKNSSKDAIKLYENAINAADSQPVVRQHSFHNLAVAEHSQARRILETVAQQLKSEDLDGSLKSLSEAARQLDKAEELYVKSLSIKPTGPVTPEQRQEWQEVEELTARQQQQLLDDRENIENLKKAIEELKKQQQEAQQQTQQAQQQNQQQQSQDQQQSQEQNQQDQQQSQQQNQQQQQNADNQQNQDQQQSQQQNQQDQQQGADNQQSQDQQQSQQQQNADNQQQQSQDQQQGADDQSNQDRQDSQDQQSRPDQQNAEPQNQQQGAEQSQLNDAMQQAREAVKELQKQAENLQQRTLQENARQAEENLREAEAAQQQQDYRSADEKLQEALQKLGMNQEDQSESRQQEQEKKESEDGSGQQPPEPPQPSENNQSGQQLPQQPGTEAAGQAGSEEEPPEIDPAQAKAILEMMARQEQELRDQIKAARQRAGRLQEVEKDW